MPESPTKPRSRRVYLTMRIDPELRGQLKAAAALDGLSMEQKLHMILCRALDRPDLLDSQPEPASA